MNPSIYGSLPSDACTLGTAGSYGNDRITRTSYDNAGVANLVQTGYGVTGVVAGEGAPTHRTTYVYDGQDRLSQTQYPSATQGTGTSNSSDYEQLSYDAAGNVTSRRLRDGTSIGYSYDYLNRPTFKDLPGSEPDVSYTYDLRNRMTGASYSGHALS